MRGVRLLVLVVTCWAVVLASVAVAVEAEAAPSQNPYVVYRQLRHKVLNGTVSPADQPGFDLVLTAGSERRKAAELLARTSGRGAEEARRGLHRLLIRARPNPDVLHGFLKKELRESLALARRRPQHRGKVYAWRSSYLLDASLTAFERTGQRRFLVLAGDTMLEMLRQRDDRHGRVDEVRRRTLATWGSTFTVNGRPRFTNVVTHAGRIATPMARYAVIVGRRRDLPDTDRRTADQLLRAATAALREFESEFRTRDNGTYGFYWRTIHNQREALNHQTSVGEALIHVAEATGKRRWKRRSVQVARFVRRVMYRDTNGTLVWRYNATPTDRRSGPLEAIWKAQVTIRYMAIAERSGVVFDRATLKEVGRTIRVNVLLDRGLNWVISAERPRMQPRYGGLKNVPAFLLLEPYDARLGERLLDRMARDPRLGGWFTPYAASAYAARLPASTSAQRHDAESPSREGRSEAPAGGALPATGGGAVPAGRRRRREWGCRQPRRARLTTGGSHADQRRWCAAGGPRCRRAIRGPSSGARAPRTLTAPRNAGSSP